MPDFGVLNAIRELLSNEENLQKAGVSENIHFAIPPKIDLPFVLLELEEIWTSKSLTQQSPSARLKLKASIFCQTFTGSKSAQIANSIHQFIDGKVLDLKNGKEGVIRMSESIVGKAVANKPRDVQQYYEVLIRG